MVYIFLGNFYEVEWQLASLYNQLQKELKHKLLHIEQPQHLNYYLPLHIYIRERESERERGATLHYIPNPPLSLSLTLASYLDPVHPLIVSPCSMNSN